jgi:ketosteroid isomerase-like protein
MMLLSAIASVIACGGGDGKSADERAIEKNIRDSIAGLNAGDFDAWSAGATDAGLKSVFPFTDGTSEGYRTAFEGLVGTHYDIVSITNIEVDGDRATATASSAFSFQGSDPDVHIVNASRNHYIRVDGKWLYDSYDNASPAVPDGVSVVRVTADEFSWGFDADAMKRGDIALQVDNVGKQSHQIDLRRIPDDLDLPGWVSGAEFSLAEIPVGGTLPFEPGESRVVVFSAPLKPGRYVMSCFIADADATDGTLHIARGMYSEFRVE